MASILFCNPIILIGGIGVVKYVNNSGSIEKNGDKYLIKFSVFPTLENIDCYFKMPKLLDLVQCMSPHEPVAGIYFRKVRLSSPICFELSADSELKIALEADNFEIVN